MEEELTQKSLTQGFETKFTGRRVYYHSELGSTMEEARREALKGVAEGTFIITGEQTSGRGRLGRNWQTPQGCIAMSVILYPKMKKLPHLVMLASLAVVNTIREITGIDADIKWPNDVLINGKKICGILVESGMNKKNACYAVIGIGLNINLDVASLEEAAATATSLSDETGGHLSRLEVTRKLMLEIEKLYLQAKKDSDAVFRQWQGKLETTGREIGVRCGEQVYRGMAESVEEDGSLNLRLADGSLKKINAGDVTLQKQ